MPPYVTLNNVSSTTEPSFFKSSGQIMQGSFLAQYTNWKQNEFDVKIDGINLAQS